MKKTSRISLLLLQITACICLLFSLTHSAYAQNEYIKKQSNNDGVLGNCPINFPSFSPAAATTGDTVTIVGQLITCNILSVSFGGLPAQSFKVYDNGGFDYKIKAIVGNGASGNIEIQAENANTAVLPGFTFLPPVIQDTVLKLCPPMANGVINSDIAGSSYLWEVSSNNTIFTSVVNNSNYVGANAKVLMLTGIPSSWSGNYYRCQVDGKLTKPVLLSFENIISGSSINLDWENISNWSCNVLPDSNTDVIITGGNVFLNSNVTVKTLTVKPGAKFTVATGYKITIKQ